MLAGGDDDAAEAGDAAPAEIPGLSQAEGASGANSTEDGVNQIEALKIAKVNYYSLIPWLNAIVTKDRINKIGSIWILSSVAGDRGRPSNYHYGAAKAALGA